MCDVAMSRDVTVKLLVDLNTARCQSHQHNSEGARRLISCPLTLLFPSFPQQEIIKGGSNQGSEPWIALSNMT